MPKSRAEAYLEQAASLTTLAYGEPVIEIKEQEHRCPHCGALLFKGRLGEGTAIEGVCRKCKETYRKSVL